MRRRGTPRGFTLVELMVVLTIMGITVGLAMPSMSASMADRRVSLAARDIVRLYRQARYSSMAYGRAHGVAFYADPITYKWYFKLYRGDTSGCLYHNWGGRLQGTNNDYIAAVREDDYDPDDTREDSVRVEGWNYFFMCYEGGANNRLWRSQVFSHYWADPGNGGIAFSVGRVVKGEVKGVVRKIFIPSGAGMPRLLR